MSDTEVQFTIPATVDDTTRFPTYRGFHGQKFILDLRDLRMMNSMGIRTWVDWVRGFMANNTVVLRNCPMTFMSIAAIVVDVVPNEVVIESMILRYIDSETNTSMRCLFTRPPASKTWRLPMALTANSTEYEFDGIMLKTLGRIKNELETLERHPLEQISSLGGQVLIKE